MISYVLCVLRNEVRARVEGMHFAAESVRSEPFEMPGGIWVNQLNQSKPSKQSVRCAPSNMGENVRLAPGVKVCYK